MPQRLLSLLLALLLLACAALIGAWLALRQPLDPERPPPIDKPALPKSPQGESYFEQGPSRRPAPAPETAADLGPLGRLRLSADSPLKQGDFWIEQELTIRSRPSDLLADLYLSIDPQNRSGTRLRITAQATRLERVKATGPGPEPPAEPELLEKGPSPLSPELGDPASPALPAKGVLGALWRGGELSVWWENRLLLKHNDPLILTGPSGAACDEACAALGPRRVIHAPLTNLRDDFMRDEPNYAWRPLRGRWALTALSFPSRSANPFSLRASFDESEPMDERIHQDRVREPQYGLGIEISNMEGTLRVERITGGSPASKAGLQEEDTIVAVNGVPVSQLGAGQAYHLLRGAGNDGRKMELTVLRPHEKGLRSIRVTQELFKWGTVREHKLIPPVTDDDEALIIAGEAGWTDYRAEVAAKALGGGGMGLAIAVTSPRDYLLLRWLGPRTDQEIMEQGWRAGAREQEKLQLLRYQDGQAQLLQERPLRYRPYEFYRLALDWKGSRVTALVDGHELLSATLPDLRRGAVGLYARKGDPVYFDDVTVDSDRQNLDLGQRPLRRLNEVFAQERDMEAWANPALDWQRDGSSPWALHASRHFGEQWVLLREPQFDQLEIRLLTSEQPEQGAGAILTVDAETGLARLRLGGQAQGAPLELKLERPGIQRLFFRAGPQGASVEFDGQRLVAPAGPALPPGSAARKTDRVAIRGLRNLGAPRTAAVSSSGTLEYAFNNAPVDWKIESGRWGLLNKWICDPRWSWFGGRGQTTAAIWNKQRLGGEQSLDAHVALMMASDDPPYERAGDFNLVLCGDGVHLDSGYALVVGGGGNFWTRLYRKGVPVAETRAEAFRLPSDRTRQLDKPELHQRWFHLHLEKIGDQLSFFRDGQKAFTYRDPAPLDEGHAGFWTIDNGVLLARCRISAERRAPGPLESRQSELFDDGTVINMYDGEVHTSVQPEPLPKPIYRALTAHPAAFVAPPPQAALEQGAAGGETRIKAWSVANGTGAGSMALQFKQLLIDPADSGAILRFAIRIEPGAAVDLVFKEPREKALYRWRLTGPRQSDPGRPLVGEIPGILADGKWRVVQVNLAAAWQALWRQRGIEAPPHAGLRPLIGCLDNHEYALAGFSPQTDTTASPQAPAPPAGNPGTNRRGARYAVSQLFFFRPGEADLDAPKVKQVLWPYDQEGDGESLEIRFDDPGGSGVETASLRLNINELMVPPTLLTFDAATQTARWNLRLWRPAEPLQDGETLAATLALFSDRAGNVTTAPFTATWRFSLAQAIHAKKPVAAPVAGVLLSQTLGDEQGRVGQEPALEGPLLRELQALGDHTQMALIQSADAPPWATLRRSVQAASLRDGATFGLRLPAAAWDLRAWPYLQLDYRIGEEIPVNLHLICNNQLRTLLLTDLGESTDRQRRGGFFSRPARRPSYLEPPPGFQADGAWHRLEIPLLRLLAATDPENSNWLASHLDLRDGGWLGNRAGMEYTLHALRALPAAHAQNIAFKWEASDLTGIADFASCIDPHPETTPVARGIRAMESVEGGARRLAVEAGQDPSERLLTQDGWQFLHLKVKNRAGIWSPTLHYRFRVDNTPPRVARTEPPDGGELAGKTIRIQLAEDHAIRADSVRLRVNGQEYQVDRRVLTLDAENNLLVFDGAKAPDRGAWPDGSRVSVSLTAVSDLLGNHARQPYAFTFTVNRGLDRQGPRIEQLRFAAAGGERGQTPERPLLLELSMALDFEETLGHVRALEDCRLEWTEERKTACCGRRAVRFVCLEDDGNMELLLHKNAWYLDQFPQLHFDYRVEGELNLNLQVLVLGTWYEIQFLGSPEQSLGAIGGVQRDGTWRHAGIDLRRLLDLALPEIPARIVSKLKLGSGGRRGCRRGAALWLDNVQLAPPTSQGGQLEWEAEADPSEIEGYGLSIDQDPGSEAPQTITDTETVRPEGGRSGTWYVHIRAQDQAGNWGPTRHLRLDF